MDHQSLAALIGQRSKVALAFSDQNAAQDNINSLFEMDNVVLGCLYDLQGQLFSAYQKSESYQCAPSVESDFNDVDSSSLIGSIVEIDGDGENFGWVYIASDRATIEEKIIDQIVMSAILAIIVIILTFVLAGIAKRHVSGPIEQITSIAKEIQLSPDGSRLRSSIASNDEIGLLSNTFNQMLDSLEVKNHQQKEILR